jgi:hypothetical protein
MGLIEVSDPNEKDRRFNYKLLLLLLLFSLDIHRLLMMSRRGHFEFFDLQRDQLLIMMMVRTRIGSILLLVVSFMQAVDVGGIDRRQARPGF